MKKQTVLYILLIFLIISNGFFLVRYLGKSGNKSHRPESFLAKKLDFDEKQMEEFNSIKTLHFDKVKSISKEIVKLKGVMYSKLSDKDVSMSYLDSIVDLIAVEEKKKDLEMFKHFQNVRTICNDEQKEKLTKFINDAIKRHGRGSRHRKRN